MIKLVITLSALLVACLYIIASNLDLSTNDVVNPDRQSYVIPEWVKQNAYWWAEDVITDEEFSYSIEFLIDEGIIKTFDCKGECM